MQPIPVKRINDNDLLRGGKGRSMWSDAINSKNHSLVSPDERYTSPRYVLAESLNDADEDAKLTPEEKLRKEREKSLSFIKSVVSNVLSEA